MNKLFDAGDAVEHKLEEMDHETDRQAKKRQPWMPIGGSLIVGFLLFALAAIFYGWFG